MINAKDQAIQELINNLYTEAQSFKGLLAIVLKSQGGSIRAKKLDSDVEAPFEIIMKRVDENESEENPELELKLLEGKEEIEAVFGKPSPLVIPK